MLSSSEGTCLPHGLSLMVFTVTACLPANGIVSVSFSSANFLFSPLFSTVFFESESLEVQRTLQWWAVSTSITGICSVPEIGLVSH